MTVPRRTLRKLRRLPAGTRAELDRVLMSPPEVRADLIHKMYDREDTRHLAEALMDVEADDLLRLRVVAALREVKGTP